jgi:acyl-CoA thioesterase II
VPASADELVELLSLEVLDRNLFRGRQPDTDRQRVFGGQVAAQALMAGCHTVDPAYRPHSLHSYFLLPGDTSVPIIYDVEQLRDGRSFATRRVVARQHGRAIFFLTASFQVEEDGFEHHDRMPDAPGPDDGIRMTDLVRASGASEAAAFEKEWASLDVRYVGISGKGLPEDPDRPARARLWIRVNGDLPDDPLVHLAAFTYASDLTLLGATLVPHGVTVGTPGLQPASLDHAMWFHRPFRADEWWLYEQHAPSAQGARGLALASVFTADGRLVSSVAQEGLIRMRSTD